MGLVSPGKITPFFDVDFLTPFEAVLEAVLDGRFRGFGSFFLLFELFDSLSERDISSDDKSVVSALASSESLDDAAAFFVASRPLVAVV